MRLTAILAPVCGIGFLLAPTGAAAQTARERDLEARLHQMEDALQALRREVEAQRSNAGPSPTAPAASPMPNANVSDADGAAARPPRSMPVTPVAPVVAAATDGFRVGGTTLKLGGFVRVNMIGSRYRNGEMAVGALGKEFYLPQQIPVGDAFASNDFLISARQTRLAFSTATPTPVGDVKTYVEFDFALAAAPAGAQRSTNPYTPTFRRGFIQYRNWLIGQEWSTFQNVAVLPETTDFVGPMEGTVFVRQGIIQYKLPIATSIDLLMALENPQTESVAAANATVIDNDHDRFPDVVARLNTRTATGDFSLALLARELRTQTLGVADAALGWGVSLAGRIPFGANKRHDIRFMGTYGEGIGRYLGLGFAPDAVQAVSPNGVPNGAPNGALSRVGNLAGFVAVKIGWTDAMRSTVTYSYQNAYYPAATSPGVNKTAQSIAGNLFWTPVKSFDFGVEYRRGERTLLSGATGQLDRVEFAAKYGF